MSEEKELEEQVISTQEQMLAALVNRFVDGDVGTSQKIVDELGEFVTKKREQE